MSLPELALALFLSTAPVSTAPVSTAPVSTAPVSTAPVSDAGTRYVCQPCDLPCDTTVYEKPGTCPVCGMPLVSEAEADAMRARRTKVAVLLFDGVEIIDFTGPWEVFGAAGFSVFSVASTKRPLTTSMGLTVVPTYTFADAPAPDLVLVPGGDVDEVRAMPEVRAWLTRVTGAATPTLSVCNGAFILASAGLLRGQRATTTAGNLDALHAEFPDITAVRDRRWVDLGKVVTSGGLAAGIDAALHLVERLRDHGTAQAVALALEYDWRPDSGFAPGALALLRLPRFELTDRAKWEFLSTAGTERTWRLLARPRDSERSGLERVRAAFEAAQWVPAGGPAPRHWTLAAKDGSRWRGSVSVSAGTFTIDITRR